MWPAGTYTTLRTARGLLSEFWLFCFLLMPCKLSLGKSKLHWSSLWCNLNTLLQMGILPAAEFNGSALDIKTIHLKVGSAVRIQCAFWLVFHLSTVVISGFYKGVSEFLYPPTFILPTDILLPMARLIWRVNWQIENVTPNTGCLSRPPHFALRFQVPRDGEYHRMGI